MTGIAFAGIVLVILAYITIGPVYDEWMTRRARRNPQHRKDQP